MQDAWVQVWKQAATYDPRRGTVGAWLLTVARSRALDRYRSAASRQRADQNCPRLVAVAMAVYLPVRCGSAPSTRARTASGLNRSILPTRTQGSSPRSADFAPRADFSLADQDVYSEPAPPAKAAEPVAPKIAEVA